MSAEMFPGVPARPAAAPAEKLSPDRRRTARQKADIGRGVHPLMGGPLNTGEKCGTCAHHFLFSNGNRSWHKCELKHSSSAATDIRVGWPACRLWMQEADQ